MKKKHEKNELINKLLRTPGSFTNQNFKDLLYLVSLPEFRKIIKRVFDINENDDINKLNNSGANKGIVGLANYYSRKMKNYVFNRRLRSKGRREYLIVAEGDSWFEHPLLLKDLTDYFRKNRRVLLYSLAYAGDWISNIVFEQEYIRELSIYDPEVFLISGGGNDLVGLNKLELLVHKPTREKWPHHLISEKELGEKILKQDFGNEETDAGKRKNMIIAGTKFLSRDFWALLQVLKVLYALIFTQIIESNKFNGLKIITQGYDFAIPSKRINPFRNHIRCILCRGEWLFFPLQRKGLNRTQKENVISAMIYHYNEMLINIGKYINRHTRRIKIFHIDCRGFLKRKDWDDELHPKSRIFKKIYKVYMKCILDDNMNNGQSVYRVRKEIN